MRSVMPETESFIGTLISGQLTPSAEATLLGWQREALTLLEKAPKDGFDENDCKKLGRIARDVRVFLGYKSIARMASDLGVSAKVLSDRMKHPIFPPSLFNYQRTLSGLVSLIDKTLFDGDHDAKTPISGAIIEWRTVPSSLREKASLLSELFTDIVRQVRAINDISTLSDGFDQADKNYVISLLETTLALLKAPMVEIGLLKRTATWLKRFSANAGEKAALTALGAVAGEGAHQLLNLIGQIPK
jgi:hypothetical protein